MTTVLRLGELLEQVLLRVDGLKSLLRSSTLSREWLSIASRKEFRQQFMANHDPPLLGIILQFAVVGTDWRHLDVSNTGTTERQEEAQSRARPIRKPRLPTRLAGPEWALGLVTP